MTITAIGIITDAYQRLNRLSPGESLNADDAAFGFTRLNLLVDELSVKAQFLYKNVLTSAAQTGNITLGVGSWAAISPGDEIISATADNFALAPITMQQYNELFSPTTTGVPSVWAQDGLSTVYFYPSPTGQTIKLQTLTGVSEFADQTTTYTVPDGYKSALGAALAVRLAPSVLGKVQADLIRDETRCMKAVSSYRPAIVDIDSFTQPQFRGMRILNG